jgi:hypothetical protein
MAPHTAAVIIFHFGGRRKRAQHDVVGLRCGKSRDLIFSPQKGGRCVLLISRSGSAQRDDVRPPDH